MKGWHQGVRPQIRLLAGFGLFLLLTIIIGSIGIFQIQYLDKTIQQLGQNSLPRQRVILEMKINNALYAMGVRNYVFWRVSKYWEAAPIASDMQFIEKSSSECRRQLDTYYALAFSGQEKKWAKTVEDSINELQVIGKRLIQLADSPTVDKDKINNLLMVFENKFYRSDDFFVETLSKNNLRDIEAQIKLTHLKKNVYVLVLGLSLFFSIILGITISYIVYRSLREERLRREMLVQRMIRVEEEERKNLSRQLHDQLAQDLSALKIYLELIEKDIRLEAVEQKERIEKSRKILSNLVEKSHDISELLRPPELDELGLGESLAVLISDYKEITGCNYTYNRPPSEITLPLEYSLALYRVAQEALTNSAKYSQAKNVSVTLENRNNMIYLTITDDGIGFDYARYLNQPRRRKEDKLKLGLQGLRERIELLGGKMIVESNPGAGTKIEVGLQSR